MRPDLHSFCNTEGEFSAGRTLAVANVAYPSYQHGHWNITWTLILQITAWGQPRTVCMGAGLGYTLFVSFILRQNLVPPVPPDVQWKLARQFFMEENSQCLSARLVDS